MSKSPKIVVFILCLWFVISFVTNILGPLMPLIVDGFDINYTLAGFLPSLVNLASHRVGGLHTLYISPLKALAVDIHRNLTQPVAEMGLDISIETRSGDTSTGKRQRQRVKPPNILLTTPEQLALLLAHRRRRRG